MRLITLILLLVCLNAGATDDKFFRALHQVETSGRTGAIVGDSGRALGPYQIHKAYWIDADVAGSYSQVTDLEYSKKVVKAYLSRYCPRAVNSHDYETMARTHNGGRLGPSKTATLKYWHRFKNILDNSK